MLHLLEFEINYFKIQLKNWQVWFKQYTKLSMFFIGIFMNWVQFIRGVVLRSNKYVVIQTKNSYHSTYFPKTRIKNIRTHTQLPKQFITDGKETKLSI